MHEFLNKFLGHFGGVTSEICELLSSCKKLKKSLKKSNEAMIDILKDRRGISGKICWVFLE